MTPLKKLAIALALLAFIPLAVVTFGAVFGKGHADIPLSLILTYGLNTLILAGLVAIGTGCLGALAAWLVVMHRFPGRGFFEWALALPFAAPAFALAYAYGDIFDAAGPLAGILAQFQIHVGNLSIRSLPGAAFVLSCAFYPYVYLTLRQAFISQSVCAFEAARTLGCSPRQAFLRVALPMARPALAAGLALAVMETLADYGAVNFLSVQTLTTGVVRAWAVYGAPESAARIALILIVAAALMLWVERWGRKGQTYASTSARWRDLPELALSPLKQGLASLFCGLLLCLGLVLPAGWLLYRGLMTPPDWQRLTEAGLHSFSLAFAGAALTVTVAALIAFGTKGKGLVPRLVSIGYATPGAVMAIGLIPLAGFAWRGLSGLASTTFVSVVLLVLAYASRQSAAALEPIESGLSRITKNMSRASRTLGETDGGTITRVHLPLVRGAMLTALLMVFIDITKELPATLILRPFNYDTLAVLADQYAKDERLGQAAWPALMIVLIALLPVILISRRVAEGRPGQDSTDQETAELALTHAVLPPRADS